eukprot:2008112-Prymnesium_polylepis.2
MRAARRPAASAAARPPPRTSSRAPTLLERNGGPTGKTASSHASVAPGPFCRCRYLGLIIARMMMEFAEKPAAYLRGGLSSPVDKDVNVMECGKLHR